MDKRTTKMTFGLARSGKSTILRLVEGKKLTQEMAFQETEAYIPTFFKIQNWREIKEIEDTEEIDVGVTTAEGQSLAEELGLSYYETRPTAKKIEQIFHDLVIKVLLKDTSSSEKDRLGNGGD